ncbi:hypothetical protein B0H14DRAFT_2638077 [Mycena olivaceomarginata]|nr:hypothetical protein B0H14DRAFT_2638077 [Mycena olivaceomarginata]
MAVLLLFHSDAQPSWFVLSKEYKTLKIVPKTSAAGTDLAKYKITKTTNIGVCLFIALGKTIPNDVYISWYTKPAVEANSSVVGNFNPVIDLDPIKTEILETVPGKCYETSPTPVPAKCKRDYQEDSEDQEIEYAKRTKLLNSPSTPVASSSKNRLKPERVNVGGMLTGCLGYYIRNHGYQRHNTTEAQGTGGPDPEMEVCKQAQEILVGDVGRVVLRSKVKSVRRVSLEPSLELPE